MHAHSLRGGRPNHDANKQKTPQRRQRVGASLSHTELWSPGLQTLNKLDLYHQEAVGEMLEVQSMFLATQGGKTVTLAHCPVIAVTFEVPTRG